MICRLHFMVSLRFFCACASGQSSSTRTHSCKARILRGISRPVAPLARPMLESQQQSQVNSMTISQDLLEMLVCPVCKVPVKLLDDQSGLKCSQCRRIYPVRDDIPVMLPEEAT